MFTVIVAAIGGYCALVGLAFAFQRNLLYAPDARRVPPAAVGLSNVSEIVLQRPDGAQIIGWYGKAKAGRRTVLYFHGNGGGLANRAARVAAYMAEEEGFFIVSYRGYSGSTGRPSEQANVDDAKAAHDWLVEQGVSAADIVLYGESLGSGVAVQVAVDRPVAGLILDAPFTSIPAIGQHHYWYLPVGLLMLDRYPSRRLISRVRTPLLIIHGERDEVTPVGMGKQVFEAANEPKTLSIIAGAGHNDHHAHGAFEIVQEWLAKLPR